MDRRTFVQQTALAAAGFGVLRSLAACRSLPPAAAGSPDAAFVDLRDRYFVRHLQLNPVTSTYLGGAGYSPRLASANARLRNFSDAALQSELAFYRDTRAAIRDIDPAVLSPIARVDHEVVSAQLDFLIHQTGDLRYHERSVDTYVAEPFRGVDWQIQQMTDAGGGRLGTEDEWAQVVARVHAIPAYLMVARANLLAGVQAGNRPDRRMVRRDGITGSTANAGYFRKTLDETAAPLLGDRPFAAPMRQRLSEAGTAAATAWEQFAAFLQATYDVDETTDRFAAGEREYEWRVRTVLRDQRSAAELYAYGAEQVELYTARVVDVARQVSDEARLGLAFGSRAEQYASVRRVMEHLSADSPRNDDELLRWYVEAGERAVAYGRAHNLFDIPATYRLDVIATPPVLRSTIDAAYYMAPPFLRTGVGRFYLTPTENNAAALKEANRASVADTAIHEGFPGHDWHFKFMTQHASEISNIRWLTPGAVEDSSSMWSDSLAAEGWGLYAEELMAEPAEGRPFGFYSAGEYLYELQGQLLRAVRVRVDVGIHTGRMTFDEAMDYFTEHVSFFPGACARAASDPTARAICDGAMRAIYRYSKWPTQAITYNLGKNAIISLRDAFAAQRGSAYSAKDFHERFMRQGTIPASYFRASFLEQAERGRAGG